MNEKLQRIASRSIKATDRHLINLMIREEGDEARPYTDTEGHRTVAHGLKIDTVTAAELDALWSAFGMTPDERRWFLARRLEASLDDLRRFTWWERMNARRQRVLVSMHYQLGARGFRGFRKMIDALRRGRFEKAAREALDSRWARQTPERAQRVAKVLRDG